METPLELMAGRWYAAEFFDALFGAELRSHSPIRVEQAKPLKSGKGRLDLKFFHANYPQGVQDKHYTLQVLERNAWFILARSTGHEGRFLLIHDIDLDWIRRHFPQMRAPAEADVQAWLEREGMR